MRVRKDRRSSDEFYRDQELVQNIGELDPVLVIQIHFARDKIGRRELFVNRLGELIRRHFFDREVDING